VPCLHRSVLVTRPMPIEEVVSELNRLHAEGTIAEYAIGGAVAAQAYIAPMSTEDIDVFVIFAGAEASTLAPLQPLYTDLIPRGAKVNGPYLEIGGWPVQFLPAADPLYESAIAEARSIPFGDQSARVMGPEHLADPPTEPWRRQHQSINHGRMRQRKIDCYAASLREAD
jgi:hypothetical protein